MIGLLQRVTHMKVMLTNDGPVTFWLQVRPGGGVA
jgi:D-Tyr-tRNAtyr deacylase